VKRIFNLFPGQAYKRIRPLMMLTAAVLITSGGNAIYKRRRHGRVMKKLLFGTCMRLSIRTVRRRSLSADRILSALAARALQ
jgi:lipopolysaccharide/colanic/teichoic acid biosynthesis glycosyltransferase